MDKLINEIVKSINKDNVDFIYLIGSYSKNTYNEFSDIDIIVALNKGDSYSVNRYIRNTYVSIHYDSKEEVCRNYNDPFKYIKGYDGVNNLVVLYDPNSLVPLFLDRWNNVNYFKDFKDNIDTYINNEVLDLIEEVNKSVSGYIYNNSSKMLEGLQGLTYGMLDVLCVSEKIINNDKGMLESYKEYFNDSIIYLKLENALGINEVSLKNRVLNGIFFFEKVVQIVEYRFDDNTKENLVLVFKNIDRLDR